MANPADAAVFVSYAQDEDGSRACELADRLEAAGVSVWLADRSIPGAQNYGPEVVAAIRACRVLVLLCSAASLSSGHVAVEVQLAFEADKPRLPLRLDDTPFPDRILYWLTGANWIDVRGPAGGWLPEVLRALERLGVGGGGMVEAPSAAGSPAAVGMAGLPSGTVTFLFTDVEASTRLWEQHRDAMGEALAVHDEILRTAIGSVGGYVFSTMGDGMGAAFATPRDGVDAAVAAQLALSSQRWGVTGPLRVRMGLHTGLAEVRGGDYFGPALNRTARLMAAGHGGQVLCSQATADVIRDALPASVGLMDLGQHGLRDLARPERVYQVTHPDLPDEFPPLRSMDGHRSNLPHEVSGFVGRGDDVAAVLEALAASRLVSIVGVGGVGKTRLALRVGSEVMPGFDDGVWLCELASVQDADTVAEAVAVAVGYVPGQGLTPSEGLARFFEHKRLLLILDNCEHLLGSVARFAATMLEAAAGLSVLVTSREALGVAGERVYLLPTLELPDASDVSSVLDSEAGTLFVLRAQEARAGFAVASDNAAAVGELCTRLDGIPLAIELAAARTALMSPAEILGHLDERVQLLTGARTALERHQTLRAAIDWSFELLDDQERMLLMRLSVFVGGFDLDAAGALGTDAGLDPSAALEVLGSLVAKSLVERSEPGPVTRYRLLEMVRQYAAEHLQASGDAADAHDAHARHYLGVARALFAQLATPADVEALKGLETDTANLVAAGRWLLGTGRLEMVLGFFPDLWFDTGMLPFALVDELGRLADSMVREPGARDLSGFGAACFVAASRAFFTGDIDQVRDYVELETPHDRPLHLVVTASNELAARGNVAAAAELIRPLIAAARQDADPIPLIWMLAELGLLEGVLHHPEARAYAEEAVALARQTGSRSALVYPLVCLVTASYDNPARALAAAEECIRIDPSQRRLWATAAQGAAASIRFQQGETSRGLRLTRDTIEHLHWSGEHFNLSLAIAMLANDLAPTEPELALQLAAISEARAISPFGAFDVPTYENLADATRRLGPQALDTARAHAAPMSYADAISYVFNAIDQLLDNEPGPTVHVQMPGRTIEANGADL